MTLHSTVGVTFPWLPNSFSRRLVDLRLITSNMNSNALADAAVVSLFQRTLTDGNIVDI